MPKFSYFNDTGREVNIHPATEGHGTTCDMSVIKPLEIREFHLPEGTYPWVKQWSNGTILVSPTRDDVSDNGRPKHMGKYPVDFSFTSEQTGEKILEFCDKTLQTPDLDTPTYVMIRMIQDQIKRHLGKGE
jgi:hypothetical protein